MAEIAEAITAAQSFVFVVSPDSIASEVCRRELAFAVEQHKRLIPIVRRHVDPGQLPDAIAKLQLLPFGEGDDFNVTICALLNAIRYGPRMGAGPYAPPRACHRMESQGPR